MAKDKFTDYDTNPANNTDIGGISLAEGVMVPSDINNAMREQMSHLAEGLGQATPLYVDQTNNRLGINTTTPAEFLEVSGSGSGTTIRLTDTGASAAGGIDFYGNTTESVASINGIFSSGSINISADPDAAKADSHIKMSVDGAEKARLQNDGKLGIGTTSPDAFLHVKTGSYGGTDTLSGEISIEDNANVSLQFASPNANSAEIRFGDPEDLDVGQIKYDHSNNTMSFRTNGSDCLSLSSAGRPTFDAGSSTGTNATFTTTGANSNIDLVTSAGTVRLRNENTRLEIFGDYNSDGATTADSEVRFFPRGTGGATFRILGDGDIKADAGFGSTTSVYLPRAWIHYNHATDTLAESGNVSSVSDDGTGRITVNFTTNMPDNQYVIMGTASDASSFVPTILTPINLANGSVEVQMVNLAGTLVDRENVMIAFLR